MIRSAISRRTLVQQGGAALAGLSVLRVAGPTSAFQPPVTGEVIPWLEQDALDVTTLEANKALVRRLFAEAVNGGNIAVIGELYAPAVLKRRPAGQLPGPGGMPLPIDQFHALFPDVSVTVESTIAEDDFVATRAIWRGTHPPADAHVVGRTMHMFRIANEQIIEQWSTGWEWLIRRDYRLEPRPSQPLAGA